MRRNYFVPLRLLLAEFLGGHDALPTQWLTPVGGESVLDAISVDDFSLRETPEQLELIMSLGFEDELVLGIPGLKGISLVLGGSGQRTAVKVETDLRPPVEVRLADIAIRVRFDGSILKPVRRRTDGAYEPDPAKASTEIALTAAIRIDGNGDISVDGVNQFELPPAAIGDSGVVISGLVAFDLSRTTALPQATALGLPVEWRGCVIHNAVIHLPSSLAVSVVPADFTLTNCAIGSGGVSGAIRANWTPQFDPATHKYVGRGAGTLAGVPFGLRSVELDFEQSLPTISEIQGEMLIPFFEQPLGVTIGIGVDGTLAVRLSATQPAGVTYRNGLVTFEKENVLRLRMDSMRLLVRAGRLTVQLSGEVTPRIGRSEGLEWATFKIDDVEIDSDGNVRLAGGWLNLREQYSLNFYGFRMEIVKLGFGKTEDGGKWVGFSGSLKLVDGLPAGASVEGLRIVWYDDDLTGSRTTITLNGIGVEFEVPDVLRFKGAVSWNGNRFEGAIKVVFEALDFEVDGALVIDSVNGQRSLAIFLDTELPAGIPLFATGLSIYGMGGLFALEREPDKQPDEAWYSLERPDWYHRGAPGVGDLGKWAYRSGSLAFGAGVTLGTVSDNGYVISGKVLLVIVFPGPIVLIEGRANLLKERPHVKKADEEGLFRAIAVLDNRAGTFLLGLDAQYKQDGSGKLIDIRGGAEAFFSLSDASLWHLYLGQRDPREKRISARMLSIFEANAYLMLDSRQLATGAWLGYDKHWEFGPLGVVLQAWIDGNAMVSWKPVHFTGDLGLHGKAELHVFWIDLGMTVDANFAADVFDPFHIRAGFGVCVSLPWPLDDVCADITLEWGPEPTTPPLPLPLKEIAVEHLKVTTSWPLVRGSLLLPNYDTNSDGFRDPTDPAAVADSFLPYGVPIVPLDCRPHITFGRPVNDDALVGANPQPPVPDSEQIGDPGRAANYKGPGKLRYGLKEVELSKRVDAGWQRVARSPDPDPDKRLYASWAPIPAMPDGGGQCVAQTKLWLWSKSAFDYTHHSGPAWDDWFTTYFVGYPCIPVPPDRETCCDFKSVDTVAQLRTPFACGDPSHFVFSWLAPEIETVTVVDSVEGVKALCFPGSVPGGSQPNEITIDLPEPVKRVVITFVSISGIQVTGYDADGTSFPSALPLSQRDLAVDGRSIVRVVVSGDKKICLLSVCGVTGLDDADRTLRQEMNQHLVDELGRWSQKDNVLEPHTTYRLKIATTIDSTEFKIPDFNKQSTQVEYAYFRTDGPPALTALSPPAGGTSPDFQTGLDDLSAYVRQTVPATVPPAGQRPFLPRPVYRAYDVGVQFNENYVDLMYRMERRDLRLYLFDNSNRAIRDAQGRLIVLNNRWGVGEDLTLTDSETRWIVVVNASGCATLDSQTIPHDTTLTSAADGQVLEPDTVYEARLVPLLLHEPFADKLMGWQKVDEGTNDGSSAWDVRGHSMLSGGRATATGSVLTLDGSPDLSNVKPNIDVVTLSPSNSPLESRRIVAVDDVAKTLTVDAEPNLGSGPCGWTIPERGALVQTSNIWGGASDGSDLIQPGTMLLREDSPAPDRPDQAGTWTDCRVSVYMRSSSGGAIGIVFRFDDSGNYYRFMMDRDRRHRRLAKILMTSVIIRDPTGEGREVIRQVHTTLAEDDFVFRLGQDYFITIEAIGSSLRVYQDGELVFSVTDGSIDHGRIGLYCWRNPGASFNDLRVDDFRKEAPVAYRFKLTTSLFANFFHQLHSYQDETWMANLGDQVSDPDIERIVQAAVSPSSTPAESEARAYEDLASLVLNTEARKNAEVVETTRVERGGKTLALLIRGPEPFDWKRATLDAIRHTGRRLPVPTVPGDVKLTGVTFGTTEANEETISLLLRQPADPTGQMLQYLRPPGPLAQPADETILLLDEFAASDDGGDPLQHYTIIDEGSQNAPSDWRRGTGAVIQASSIGGGAGPAFPGTQAVAGDATWTDYRVIVRLCSDTDQIIGVLFRYADADNYYRLSLNAQNNVWHLIKKANGSVTLLGSGAGSYSVGESFTLTVDAVGARLVGYLNGRRLFGVSDLDQSAGSVGLYCWTNPGARFEHVEVRRPPQEAFALFRDRFVAGDTRGWAFASADGPAAWSLVGNELRLISSAGAPEQGTQAVADGVVWSDGCVSARLRSVDFVGVLGVMFRYTTSSEFYRFSMDFQTGIRQLTKQTTAGGSAVLWSETAFNVPAVTYEIAITVIGGSLRGYLNDVPLFVVDDAQAPIGPGQAGLYAWRTGDARFSDVRVYGTDQLASKWLLDEPFDVAVPDRWSFVAEGDQGGPPAWAVGNRDLNQTSGVFGGSEPDMPGAYAEAGDTAWTDYRTTVRLRSEVDGTLGVMFRLQDQKNYYRFSMDFATQPGGMGRLIKKVAGVVTLLWQHQGVYVQGSEYVLTLDCDGDRLTGYVNGEFVFGVNDGDLASGRVALYVWRNTGAHFSEIQVSEPTWATYYRFGREVRLPAGTRICVHSGNAADAPAARPEDAGVVQRYAASLEDRGQPRFPSNGVELRVVKVDGTAGHQRRFLPDPAYESLPDARVIRSRDGTGFFVLSAAAPPIGATLTPGNYRLAMSYRRDNRATDPDSQVLSQVGSTLDESVVLDIPWQT